MKRKSYLGTDSGINIRRTAFEHDIQNERWNEFQTKRAFKKGTKCVWFILKKNDIKDCSKPLDALDVLEVESGISAWNSYLDKDLTLRKIAEILSEIPFLLRDITIDPRCHSMRGWGRLNTIHSDQDVDKIFLHSDMSIGFVLALDFIEGTPQAGPSASLPLLPTKEARPKKKQKTVNK